jgi:hypothetical protein
MTEFVPAERGTNIRFPSTANLYIDSLDRSSGTSVDFIINKKSNILTGFFTRLAVQEVVMNWCIPNISDTWENRTFTATIDETTETVELPEGEYTVKQALDVLVSLLNTAFGGTDFSITQPSTGGVFLTNTNQWTITPTRLSGQLGIIDATDPVYTSKLIECPNLVPTNYIDIICDNLTYCQNLKDASTTDINYTTLYRWYMAWDNETSYDAYGFPVYQSYRPFIQRRCIAFPKQIKWDNIQPIGQLAFKVYDDVGNILTPTEGKFEFNMNLLVSEV